MQRRAFWFITLVPLLFALTTCNAQWEDALASLLSEFQHCRAPVASNDPCYTVTARAVMAVYGINDFADEAGGAMNVKELIVTVKSSSAWRNLGAADEQDVLSAVQEAANEGRAVLAVFEEEPAGHVAVILPGKLGPSGKWSARVPNSASFFLNTPGRSYVGKTLAYAFKEKAMVRLYARNN